MIDEASLLCLPLTFQILKKVPSECRLILVGDPEQLPPIGPGLVFHLLAKDTQGLVPAVELTKVYRQSSASGIPTVATMIRQRRWPDLPGYCGKGRRVSIAPTRSYEVEEMLQRVYADLGGNDPASDVQVLCVTRDGSPVGVSGINTSLQNMYATGKKQVCCFNEIRGKWVLASGFAVGDPVMFTRNDWGRNLRNGSLGVIAEAYDPPRATHGDPWAHKCARILFDTGPQDMTARDFSNMELAYAITVHQSAGSRFKRVIVALKKSHLLDKALVYTAVTRGVEQVVLVGDIEAAKQAVEAGAAGDRRQVGLGCLMNRITRSQAFEETQRVDDRNRTREQSQ